MAVYKLSEDYELSKYAELLDIDAFIKNREKGDYKEYLQKMSEVLESFFDRDKRDKYLEPIKNDFYELIRLKSREDQYKNKLKDFIRKYHHILSAIFIYHMKSIKRRGDRIGDNEGHLISEIFDTTNSEKIDELNKMLEKVAIICLGHRQIDLKDLRDVEGTDTKVIRICSAILKLADELEINKDRIRDLKKEYIKDDKEAIEHIGKDVITYVEINHKNYEIILNTDLNTLERDFKIELTDSNLVGIAKKVKDTVNKVKEFINELNSLFMDHDDFKPFVGSILPIHVKDNIAGKNLRYEDSDLFRVNIKGIIDLFIGEYLYKDRYVCIRELIQNSIDAYRDLGKIKEIKEIIIDVDLNFDGKEYWGTLTFTDYGRGMSIYDIKEYLTKIGSCYYREKKDLLDFQPISKFGVGILSCFKIADKIEIKTKNRKSKEGGYRVVIEEPKDFIAVFNEEDCEFGTSVKLYLKNDSAKELYDDLEINEQQVENSLIIKKIKEYVAYSDIPIKVSIKKDSKELLKDYEVPLSLVEEKWIDITEDVEIQGISARELYETIKTWNDEVLRGKFSDRFKDCPYYVYKYSFKLNDKNEVIDAKENEKDKTADIYVLFDLYRFFSIYGLTNLPQIGGYYIKVLNQGINITKWSLTDPNMCLMYCVNSSHP
jgi:hypothetical protein